MTESNSIIKVQSLFRGWRYRVKQERISRVVKKYEGCKNGERIVALKDTNIYLPTEIWNIIYSYVGKSPFDWKLCLRNYEIERFRDRIGDSMISNRSLKNLKDFNVACGRGLFLSKGTEGKESNIRDYDFTESRDDRGILNHYINTCEMRYFKEYDSLDIKPVYEDEDGWEYLNDKFCSEKIGCICGSSVMRKGLKSHLHTPKHKKYMISG